MCVSEEPPCYTRKWYFSRKEIEDQSPSGKDGIDFKYESHLRESYCQFLQKLGKKIKVPQVTIASGMMLCHRFYIRQSHAKNDWQTIATASMFLGCKIEETPRFLKDVVVAGYELMYEWDNLAQQRIKKQSEVYDKYKELILVGERLLLSTIAFDLDIQLPYKPLVAALKTLELSELSKVAWNFVNDSLRTTLCLQYKPHYIAAGSIFLAATVLQNMELLTKKRKVWWLEFEVSPKQLKEAIQQMMLKLLKQDGKKASRTACGRITQSEALAQKAVVSRYETCISSGSTSDCHSSHGTLMELGRVKSNSSQNLEIVNSCLSVKEALPCQMSDGGSGGSGGSASSVVEDDDGPIEPQRVESDCNSSCKIVPVQTDHSKIDTNRIREAIKRRRDTAANKKFVEAINAEIDDEAWIERELENGIELGFSSSIKKTKEDVSF